MNEVTISEEMKSQSHKGIDYAKNLVISTQRSLELAAEFVRRLAKLKKEIVTTFKDPKEKAWETHKSICEAEKKHLKPIADTKQIVDSKMAVYVTHQERIAQKIADDKVAAEREILRIEAEKQARIEEENRKIDEALKLEYEGKQKEAEAIISEPIKAEVKTEDIQAPVVNIRPQEKIDGIHYRTDWLFEIVDIAKIPRIYMIPNESAIGKIVRINKEKAEIPGVRIYSKKNTIVK